MDVDPLTSEAYAAVDRTLAEHENDILLTMAHAPNVTAILTPDAPGTYVVLVTVADACNATASALTNATAMCSHRPVAAVTNETDGVRPWDQKLAMAHVSEKYAFGWWPAHALDASATASDPADEADYFESRRAFDARLAGEAMFEEDQEGGQGIPVPIIVVNNNNAPQPSPPPPPTNRPLYALEEWTEWTSAPTWDAPFHEGDGLLYEWTLTDARARLERVATVLSARGGGGGPRARGRERARVLTRDRARGRRRADGDERAERSRVVRAGRRGDVRVPPRRLQRVREIHRPVRRDVRV